MARLALIISGMGAGGAERVMSILAGAWAARGDHVVLLTLAPGDAPSFYPLHPAIAYRPLGIASVSRNPVEAVLANLRRLIRLRRAIREARPDAVLSFGTEMNVLTLAATRCLGLRVVVSERNDPRHYPFGRPWRLARSLAYRVADAVATQTRAAANALAGMPRVVVVPNPAPTPPAGEARPTGPRPHVIAVGRLVPDKGFDLLLEAFARVAPLRPEWSLTVLGEGPARAELERRAALSDLAGRVRLPGVLSDAAGAMRGADLLVLSSRFEGFPNVLCEAMALGLPVIATDCESGPADLVEDGVNGLLVPPENVEALAAALLCLTGDADERTRLARAAPGAVARLGVSEILAAWDALLFPEGRRNGV